MSLPGPRHKGRFVEDMFDRIAPRYDLTNRLMTLGIDRIWRRRAVRALGVGPGARVLDLGCGTGDLMADLARTGACAVGIDRSGGMMARGRRRLGAGVFVRGDAQRLPVADASVDGVVSAFALRNFTSIPAAMCEAVRVLKPGGRFALLEVHVPPSKLRRVLFSLYFTRLVPILGGLLSHRYAYDYLAASLEYLPDFVRYRAILVDTGFVEVSQQILFTGTAQLVTAVRSAGPSQAATQTSDAPRAAAAS